VIKKVSVIDYGAGNLKSIVKAIKILGLDTEIISPKQPSLNFLYKTDLLVLPGVGNFGSAMKELRDIKDKILEYTKIGKPLLGICLGIQLLFDKSEESPGKRGLGIISGEVVKFNSKIKNRYFLPIPHMCWNTVKFINLVGKKEYKLKKTILKGLKKEEFFYFVHSFYPKPKEDDVIFGTTKYGEKFCSMIVKKNIVATQFHLEKSGNSGLLLLKNIINYFEKM